MKKPIQKIEGHPERRVSIEERDRLILERLVEYRMKFNEIIDRVNELYDNQK